MDPVLCRHDAGEVTQWLHANGLPEYAAALRDAGYDHLVDVAELVAEDSEQSRESLRRLVTKEGHRRKLARLLRATRLAAESALDGTSSALSEEHCRRSLQVLSDACLDSSYSVGYSDAPLQNRWSMPAVPIGTPSASPPGRSAGSGSGTRGQKRWSAPPSLSSSGLPSPHRIDVSAPSPGTQGELPAQIQAAIAGWQLLPPPALRLGQTAGSPPPLRRACSEGALSVRTAAAACELPPSPSPPRPETAAAAKAVRSPSLSAYAVSPDSASGGVRTACQSPQRSCAAAQQQAGHPGFADSDLASPTSSGAGPCGSGGSREGLPPAGPGDMTTPLYSRLTPASAQPHLLGHFKIIVLGDVAAGKSTFIHRLVHRRYNSCVKATIGADWAETTFAVGRARVRLQFWDIGGHERFSSMTRVYYQDAHGAIICFDRSVAGGDRGVARWKRDVDNKVFLGGRDDGLVVPCVLLANKSDLPDRSGGHAALEEQCRRLRFTGAFDTSAKTGHNVEAAVHFLLQAILKNAGGLERSPESPRIGSVRLTRDEPGCVPRARCRC
eukprot:TRINITY_DN3121_c1_g1_i2.p1 TRINITY_DN3121_c1_g1~~TRINITY_DN3121_c1_g1_i2.p1  ORF type:complete len:554 (+),score=150.48 TRINITY_DN3121_c1_g1_i2:148-1809(+)